jgi:putative FmdB family regulatory protein
MPLYPFVCGDCHTEFETLVVRHAPTLAAECPACGSPETSRRFAVPAKMPVSSDFPDAPAACGAGPSGAVGFRRRRLAVRHPPLGTGVGNPGLSAKE